MLSWQNKLTRKPALYSITVTAQEILIHQQVGIYVSLSGKGNYKKVSNNEIHLQYDEMVKQKLLHISLFKMHAFSRHMKDFKKRKANLSIMGL